MKKIIMFCALVVLFLAINSTQADMTLFLSGDSNIINTGLSDAGNQQFFSNVLGTGTNVAFLDTGYLAEDQQTELVNYYNSLTGVTASVFTGTVTASQLSGVDLFVSILPGDDFTAAEISVMQSYLYGGGDIFFAGEHGGFASYNARINGALSGIGSSLSIFDAVVDDGYHTATGAQIATDPYTAGVTTFTYAASSQVLGGTTLFYGTGGQPFVTYEVVPIPGAVLLGMLGLSAVGIKLRKFA
jgi:hypothetical protein